MGLNVFQLFSSLEILMLVGLDHIPFVPCLDSPYLWVILAHAAVLVSRNNIFGQVTPSRNGCLALLAGNLEAGLVGLVGQVSTLSVSVSYIVDDYCSEVSHTLLRNG